MYNPLARHLRDPRAGRARLVGVAAVTGVAACLLLPGCGRRGSGTIGQETRDISGITAVEVTGDGHLSIEQTGVESLSIETDDNLLDRVSTDVVDGTLVLEPRGIINPTNGIAYRLTVATLEAITVTGSGTVEVTGLDAQRLDVEISGSGLVTVAGTTTQQHIDIGGGGLFYGRDLHSATTTIDIGGNGTATVTARRQLDVKIDGNGVVTYYGDPTVDEHVDGAGHVRRGEDSLATTAATVRGPNGRNRTPVADGDQ